MDYNTKEIIEDIYTGNETKSYYKYKYPNFFKDFPVLSEKLFDPSFDSRTLNYMLNQLDKIKSSKLSSHDASVKVGTMLVDKYVKPQL